MSIESDASATSKNSLGLMVQRLSGRLGADMVAELVPYDLALAQFAILMAVLGQDGQSQAEIGKQFRMPAYAISRAIDGLEAQGRLSRRVNPKKRQAHCIYVTQAARDLAPELFAIVARMNAALVAPLSAAEQVQFKDMLERVYAHKTQS